MKKEAYRDYATAAFELYGRNEDDETWNRMTPEEQDDLRCCRAVMIEAAVRGRQYVADAVRAVYMAGGARSRSAISARVVAFGMANGMDERTVYRYLAEARAAFARFRGLRM